jgi:hypothetical protein
MITVLIADAQRLQALNDGLNVPGRVLRFSDANLTAAFESIREQQPGVVVFDALFAQTSEGQAFVDRVQKLLIPQSEIRLVALVNGAWIVTPIPLELTPPLAGQPTGLNTRRAPRFPLANSLEALVEGRVTSLVDLSVLGAQVISEPVLRPNQRIKVALPDADETLQLTANVAWSLFEKPPDAVVPHFRAGVEFIDAMVQAMEEYCGRHCVGEKAKGRRRR